MFMGKGTRKKLSVRTSKEEAFFGSKFQESSSTPTSTQMVFQFLLWGSA